MQLVGETLGFPSWYICCGFLVFWAVQYVTNTSVECIVAPFTGDNSATVLSLSAPGDAILSLGTSTTFLLSIPPSNTAPKRCTTSHLLAHPIESNAQIAMLCYKNGALAREQVRDRHAAGDWAKFSELVEETPVGNDGYLGLYFPLPEIIPPGVVGEFFFSCKDALSPGIPTIVGVIPSTAHPRAILESQFLSIRSRISDVLPEDAHPLRHLVVVGGSSVNQAIMQLAADILRMRVYVVDGWENKEAACVGGALLARFVWWRERGIRTFKELDVRVLEKLKCVAEPRDSHSREYENLLAVYRACEEVVRIRAQAEAGDLP